VVRWNKNCYTSSSSSSSFFNIYLNKNHNYYIYEPIEVLTSNVCNIPAKRLSDTGVVLKNTYIGLRHGQSMANVEGIISSDPSIGTLYHGLTEEGMKQAKQSCEQLISIIEPHQIPDLVFFSSDFTRAYETAVICTKELQIMMSSDETAPILLDPDIVDKICTVQIRKELRERYFGEYDALPLIFYNKVWPIDTINADNKIGNVESVNEVIQRIHRLVIDIEKQYSNKYIIFISHADTLQITQTYLCSRTLRRKIYDENNKLSVMMKSMDDEYAMPFRAKMNVVVDDDDDDDDDDVDDDDDKRKYPDLRSNPNNLQT